MLRIRGRLTYANVTATLALFLALAGGTAFAATQMLPKDSVGSKQIKKEAVTPAKLSKASKTTLTGPTGPAGLPGATGAAGTQGPKGDKGDDGAPGNANVRTFVLGPADLQATGSFARFIPDLTAAEVQEGAWTVKLEYGNANFYPMPGVGLNGNSTYRTYISVAFAQPLLEVSRTTGTGESYTNVILTLIPPA